MPRVLPTVAAALLLAFNVANAESVPAPSENPVAGIEESGDFRRVTPVQPTDTAPGEIEVLEFFWYGCRHCYRSEKPVTEWLQNLPDNVVFRRVPATLNQGWTIMARAFYTAEQLDVLETMHPALFAAFHQDSRKLDSEDALAAYFMEKAGVDEAAFRETFNSMTVASRVHRADQLSRRYRLSGVPTMVVNGKYATDPEMAGGYAEMVGTVDTLARRELQPETTLN